MANITLHRSYCSEHIAVHMVDDRGQCYGADNHEVRLNGWTYHRHIGGGWFEYRETNPDPLPLEWEILADAHANQDEIEIDF